MAGRWLDITDLNGKRRVELLDALTRLGGGEAEVTLEGITDAQLHVWSDPPRMIFLGGGEGPRHAGERFDEHALQPGDRIHWRGILLEFGSDEGEATLQELEETSDAEGAAGMSPAELRIWRRVQAGLLVDVGFADRASVKRAQNAVLEENFEPDQAAEEILSSATVHQDELRLLDRSGRLLRDFLMAPLMKGTHGAGRRARRAARGGFAFVLAQGLGLLVYSIIVLAALLLMRLKGVSFDDLFDRILPGD